MAVAPRKFKTGAQVRGKLTLPDESASKALTVSSTGDVTSSVTTDAELAFLSGTTSNVQTQLNAKGSATNVAALVTLSGVSAGATDLGSFTGSIIPDNTTIKAALQSLETAAELVTNPLQYKGTYNATTNTPALANTDTGKGGYLYQVTVAGTHDFGAGPITFAVNDKVVNNGTIWEKWDVTDDVLSVNGKTGVVVLTTTDIAEGSNLYYTDGRAQTAAVVDSMAGTQTVQAPSVSSVKAYLVAQGYLKADGSVPLTADFSAGTHKITNLATPTNPADAVTKAYADALVANAGSPGDISQTSFSIANNQAAAANVTGFAFSAASVRSFSALVSVAISATTPLYEEFEIHGIQRAADFAISVESTGNDSGIAFDITSAGQVQYTGANYSGFTAGVIKFRCIVTNV